ncbi:MAG: hypothetical protein HC888_11610 [Candidatus Competibacteraceae bacterium]|nr:hypothetical protein [Candidatus Competibacteraceae bacterium]
MSEAMKSVDVITGLVEGLNEKIRDESSALEQSSVAIEEMMASLRSVSQVSLRKQESVQALMDHMGSGRESMAQTLTSIKGMTTFVDGIAEAMEMIDGVASNTNLLAMNAAIEAAHAGEFGKGFAVVADEIRRLSDATKENSHNISLTLSRIVEEISVASDRSSQTDGLIHRMSDEVAGFTDTMSELINTFSELSAGSSQITSALMDLKTLSTGVKDAYGEILSLARRLRSTMASVADSSSRELHAAKAGT